MAGAPALLVWPWHYQPVAHRLNQEHGKRRWSWSWRLQTAWRLIHSLPAQWTRSTRVDVNFRISLFLAEIWRKYIQPSQLHCLGVFSSLYNCAHIPFTFWQPCKAGTRRYYLMEQILFQLSWLPYSTYLYLNFYLCSRTKLKEHSREIC